MKNGLVYLNNEPTRYFGIGLSKTATSSLFRAFIQLKMTGRHYINANTYSRMLTGEYSWDFVNDLPICNRYEELDKHFPNAKFIYTHRNIDDWLLSCKTHWAASVHRTRSYQTSDWKEYRMETYGRLHFNSRVFRRVFFEHQERVCKYFATRPNDFLMIDIPGGDGWEKLCPFINQPIPDVPFPHSNKTNR